MKHLDLFAGIGGFSLAARWAGWETVAHCEIDPFCQKVLHKHFPNSTLHADIRELDGTQYRGTVDIITGGFPCQPYSSAGKRLGKDDERHLWPEKRRVYQEVAPRWIVGENVLGLVSWNGGMVFEEVQADLESDGYEVTPYILPAAGVGAPHRRNRVWFVAYSNRERFTKERENFTQKRGERFSSVCGELTTTNPDSYDAGRRGHGKTGSTETESERQTREQRIRAESKRAGEKGTFTNTNISGSQGGQEKAKGKKSVDGNPWDFFPTKPGICGGNDGVPNRVDRIKALGNAIVPQVAYQIFKAINQYENSEY